MYPLNAILIGSEECLLPQYTREFLNRSIRLEAEFTSVADAINALRRSTAEKRLLLLHMASFEDRDALGRLTAHFPGWPVMALIEGYDPKAIRGEVVLEIIKAGATQILGLPIESDEFKTALERIANQFVYSVNKTKVIGVAGVSGGSGSTSIAINLASEIVHRHGVRCILVDLSIRMGVIASVLNLKPVHTILHLLRDIRRVDTTLARQALFPVRENLSILAGPNQLATTVNTSTHDLARVVDILKQIADIVILDIPCTYDDIYFETLTAASQVVLIGEQKLTSIRAMKMVREAIDRPAETEHLVINRFDPKNKAFAIDRLLKPTGASTIHKVVRDDQGMTAAMGEASMLRTASPRSPALADIVNLAELVVGPDLRTLNKPIGLFRRLGRALVNS
jgi:pilus assembly protein CpaE